MFHFIIGAERKSFGEAGMTILSKVATLGHVFGVDDGKLDTQARAITLLFSDLVLIATYNPQGGFTDETLAFKTTWERGLENFFRKCVARHE